MAPMTRIPTKARARISFRETGPVAFPGTGAVKAGDEYSRISRNKCRYRPDDPQGYLQGLALQHCYQVRDYHLVDAGPRFSSESCDSLVGAVFLPCLSLLTETTRASEPVNMATARITVGGTRAGGGGLVIEPGPRYAMYVGSCCNP